MHHMNSALALQQYRQIDASSADYSNSHQLVMKLLDGALSNLASIRWFIQQNRVPDKCEHISRTTRIVEGLRMALDRENGGQIAANLEDLYDYINRRLVLANLNNDIEIVDEINVLLNEIRSAWLAIADYYNQSLSNFTQVTLAASDALMREDRG